MFRIIITPPEEETKSSTLTVNESDAAAVAELRALGVNQRMIDMAVRHNNQHRPLPTAHIPHGVRPPLSSFDRPSVHPSRGSLDAFELMRIDASAATSSSSENSESPTGSIHEYGSSASPPMHSPPPLQPAHRCRPTRSASGDELMLEFDPALSPSGDENMISPVAATSESGSTTCLQAQPSPPPQQQQQSHRIPSSFFKHTFTDSKGHLLPPISNPDLGPSLTRADSFWVGEEEERAKEGQRNLQQHWMKHSGGGGGGGGWQEEKTNSAPSIPPLAASKTKSIYAHALNPYNPTQPHHHHLIDPQDWTTVLDATVLVANHELRGQQTQGQQNPFFSRTARPNANNATNWSNVSGSGQIGFDESHSSLKRKHHPFHSGLPSEMPQQAKSKHMRFSPNGSSASGAGAGVDSTSSTPSSSAYSSQASTPVHAPRMGCVQPGTALVEHGSYLDQVHYDAPQTHQQQQDSPFQIHVLSPAHSQDQDTHMDD